MSDGTNIIFEDRFRISDVDKEGKKFDRVARIEGVAENTQMKLTLDINSEIYPIQAGEQITLAVARSLLPEEMEVDGGSEAGENGDDAPRKVKREMWRGGDQGLAAGYEYVLYGKIYKFDDSVSGDAQTTAYFSFGGLLMALRGSYRHLSAVVVGEDVYLLIRK
ncbi:DNA-directed RNA polymerases i, ii, and iii 17.1 kda polypeptide [Papiliotrema laurentii]|uniref:DNA-directed RNA polymerases i, ii, and iii 17.1 kDa polypeptide n=1 Tax=Papiliotrema laurentii TaxID=5418 RepID=A0AAD9CU62_PAPLA|nr:DNA-directed RNA polymerases i, ii, and iii 17.1 kda polypeptide [Papiliotrema laurentii]